METQHDSKHHSSALLLPVRSIDQASCISGRRQHPRHNYTSVTGKLPRFARFFPCVSLSGEAAKKTKQWLAMEVKSTCILRSGKGGTKRHAFSDRPFVRSFVTLPTKRFMKEHAFTAVERGMGYRSLLQEFCRSLGHYFIIILPKLFAITFHLLIFFAQFPFYYFLYLFFYIFSSFH